MLLGGFIALGVGMGIGRFFYTPMLPIMQQELGFGPATAGLLASVNFAAYVAGTIVTAFIGKGPLRLMLFRIGLVVSIVATIAMGLTTSLSGWIVLRALSGFASAFVFIFAAAMIAEALGAIGEAARVGWLFGGVGSGIALSGLLVRVAGDSLSWSWLWIAAGLLGAVFAPVALWQVRDRQLTARLQRSGPIRRAPEALPLWPMFLNYSCEGLGYSAVATFIVAIVKSRPGLEAVGDWVWVIVGVAGVPSCILWSATAERIGFARALGFAYVAQIVAILLPALSGAAWAALLSALLFGGTFMAITALVLAVGRHGAGGRGFAVLTAGFGVGQVLGPLAAGYLVAGGSDFTLTLYVSAAIVGLGLLFLALAAAQRRHRET